MCAYCMHVRDMYVYEIICIHVFTTDIVICGYMTMLPLSTQIHKHSEVFCFSATDLKTWKEIFGGKAQLEHSPFDK